MKKLLSLSALAVLALAGCSSNNSDTHSSGATSGPSASSSSTSTSPKASATSPTKSATPSPTPSETVPVGPEIGVPTDFPTAAPTVSPSVAVAPTTAVAAAPTVQDYLATGGTCISDVWNSSLPYTESLASEVHAYCDANDLGDWANGADPYDYAAYQTPAAEEPTKEAPQYGYTNNELTREQCESLDPTTAMSGQIQYCFTQYGI